MLQSTPNDQTTPAFNAVMTDEITITPAAHEQIKSLVDDEEDVEGVRIYVAGALVWTGTKTISGEDSFTDFATVAWPEGTVTPL